MTIKIITILIAISLLTGCSQQLGLEVPTLTIEKDGIEKVLKDKTSVEKIKIKSEELAKVSIGKFKKNDLDIEIIGDIKEIDGGIELFAKAWKDGKQLGFGKDGSVEIERFRFFNPPVLVGDVNGDIVREFTDVATKEIKQRKLKYDPEEAIKQILEQTINVVGKDGSNIIIGKVGNTTSTFYSAAGANSPVDGYAQHRTGGAGTGVSWSTLVGAAGTTAIVTGTQTYAFSILADTTSGQWRIIRRGIQLFNTAAIDTDEISSATFSLKGIAKSDTLSTTPNVNIYSSNPASDSNLVGGDYDSLGSTEFSSSVAYADLTNDSTTYVDFILNASGIAAIDKTGISKLGTRNANRDVANSSPTWSSGAQSYWLAYYADEAGTTSDPKLVVEHSAAVSRRIINIE